MNLPDALLSADAYPHEVSSVTLIETHMSWVFLTGDFAYKVKKPVVFEFADFRSEQARKHFCEQELELNRRFASGLYLSVVPLLATSDGLVVSNEDNTAGAGPSAGRIMDWAVKMLQFPTGQQCDHLLADAKLTARHFYAFGTSLAYRHARLPVVPYSPAGQAVLANFHTLDEIKLPNPMRKQAHDLHRRVDAALERTEPTLARRAQREKYRHCHGDLHLANLVLLDDAITAFDCLEFNDQLSQTDVWADVAFLFMDLNVKGCQPLAYAFVDGYLEVSGDYEGATLLGFFASYRAMVRAKVSALRYQQTGEQVHLQKTSTYLEWASRQAGREQGSILMTHGLSGSGKSYWSEQLVREMGCIRIRSDVLRKTSAGIAADASSESGIGTGLYTDAHSENIYQLMAEIAVALALEGENVIIDAASLFASQRQTIYSRAAAAGVESTLLSFHANEEVLRSRIRSRAEQSNDPSEADEAVLAWQQKKQDKPGNDEKVLVFDTEAGNLEQLMALIQTRT